MINITFPDGSVRQYEKGITAIEIARDLSPRLAAEVLVSQVNGHVYDLQKPIEEDASVKLLKWDDEEGKKTFWHSSSHLMAEALEALYPGVKFGIGPAIETGFYYDVDLGDKTITEADLKKIEEKMLELARQKEHFVRQEVSKAQAMETYKEKGDEYLRQIKIAAIGRPTSERLESLGFKPDIVPEDTTFHDMLLAIKAAFPESS